MADDQTNQKQNIPDVLYHYTSLEGFYGIVKEGEIWASDILFLNDSSEFKYTFEYTKKLVERWTTKRPKSGSLFRDDSEKVGILFDLLLDHYNELHDFIKASDNYVFSLTQQGNKLSQWRAYCPKGGVSIGFDVSLFKKILNMNNIELNECNYDKQIQKNLISDAILKTLKSYDKIIANQKASSEDTPDTLSDLFDHFWAKIMVLATIFKNPHFCEEEEWRLVIQEFLMVRPKIHYKPKQSFLMPYVKIPIKCDENKLPLKEIIIGPTAYRELAKISVERFLKAQGIDCTIRDSGIPYRV